MLAWTFTASQRNQMQSAYDLIISDDLKIIQLEKGNSCSAGEVFAGGNMQIEYTVTALRFKKYIA